MEERTLVHITIDNADKIRSCIDLTGIENEEDALRFIHSILDEYRQLLLNRINTVQASRSIETDDISEEFE